MRSWTRRGDPTEPSIEEWQIMFRLIAIPLATVWVLSGLLVQAQQPSETEREAAGLIEQLGSPQFTEREQASAALLAMGEAALPSLQAVSDKQPREVVERARLLLTTIEREKFDRLSHSFLLDSDDSNSYGLPAWDVYRELVGGSRTSKLLFLEMIRKQPSLATLIERAHDGGVAAQQRLIASASQLALHVREDVFALIDPRIGDALVLLLAAAVLDTQTPVEVSDVIVINERRSFGGSIHKQGHGSCLRKLLAAWIPKTHGGMAPTAMDIALRHDLSQGATLARNHLTPNFDTETRKWAFYCLARFGDETDVPRLLPFLDEETVVDEFVMQPEDRLRGSEIHESNTPPPGIRQDADFNGNTAVRVNDLALVTIQLLSNQDPRSVFPSFEANKQLGFFIHSLAAPPSRHPQRQEAIQRWKQQNLPDQIES